MRNVLYVIHTGILQINLKLITDKNYRDLFSLPNLTRLSGHKLVARVRTCP